MEANKNKLIMDSFSKFVAKFNLIEGENLESTIDDTIGSYIINTIYQFYDDYENHKIWLDDQQAEEFDIENFVEIIDAYLFGFKSLKKSDIILWLIKLKKEIDSIKNDSDIIQQSNSSTDIPVVQDTPSKKIAKNSSQEIQDQNVQLLVEMFPKISLKKINKMYKKTKSNYERTIDELLIIQDALIISDESSNETESLDEEERLALKEKTVKKFGFVPVNEDGSIIEQQAPTNVWNSEKKLTRYYDSKVVSNKGEKYFEFKTDEEIELEKQMKKTYCNLKPARKYRFH